MGRAGLKRHSQQIVVGEGRVSLDVLTEASQTDMGRPVPDLKAGRVHLGRSVAARRRLHHGTVTDQAVQPRPQQTKLAQNLRKAGRTIRVERSVGVSVGDQRTGQVGLKGTQASQSAMGHVPVCV